MNKLIIGIISLLMIGNVQCLSAFEIPHVEQPTFANYEVSIIDFGAQCGPDHVNTMAINQAIKAVSQHGGGKVIIPAGYWMTGAIEMQSNVNLYLDYNAFVSFTTNISDYRLVDTDFEGSPSKRCIAPISGTHLQNIAITGHGVFDGSGERWRPVKRSKLTSAQWKNFTSRPGSVNKKGDVWEPDSNAANIRPVLLNFTSCKNVKLEGVTFKNSPAWCVHPLLCENVTIDNIKVNNPWYAQNGDALDVESCKNVVVINSLFDAGDDAICIKSGKNEAGRRRGVPCENVYIKNNTVLHGHGGFVIGSEMSGGVKNIYISDCTFIGTDVGLRFKSARGRGGVVENIYIDRINMKNIVNEAITMNLYYSSNGKPAERTDVNEGTPVFRNIEMKNLLVEGAGKSFYLYGLPEMPLENISIQNMRVSKIAETSSINYAKNIKIEGYQASDAKHIVVSNSSALKIK